MLVYLWAMSSLTQKGKVSEHVSIASINANSSVVSASSNATSAEAEDIRTEHATSISNSLDQPTPSSPTSSEDWGELENDTFHDNHDSDKEGWADMEPIEELKPPTRLASIQAAQKRLLAQPKQHAEVLVRPNNAMKSSSSTFTDPKADDDLRGSISAHVTRFTSEHLYAKPVVDEDLWASIAAPLPKITSKTFKSIAATDDDPWAAIAAPPPTTKAKPLSAGRGRCTKPPPAKLDVQRIDRMPYSGI